jgi:hypothetical protein
MGAPGVGRMTFSDLNGSTCIWTQILRRFQIQNGKFKIFAIAFNMDESVMDIRRGLGDLLHLGWFNLYLDPFFEEILNPDTKC